jgi:hypothetical protein
MNKVSLPAFKKNLINLKHNWQKNKFDPTFYFKFLIVAAFAPVLIMVSLTEDVEANLAKKTVFKKGLLKSSLDKIKQGDKVYFNYEPIVNPMALDGVSQTAGLQIMLLPNEEIYLFKKNEHTGDINVKKSNVYQLEKEEQGYSVLLSYLLKNQTIQSSKNAIKHLDNLFKTNDVQYQMIQEIKDKLSTSEEKSYLEKIITSTKETQHNTTKKKNKI